MTLDIILIIFIIIYAYKGYKKGIVIALFSLIGMVLGMMISMKLSSSLYLTFFNSESSTLGKFMPIITYIAVFVGVAFIVRFIAKIIEKTLKLVMLGWLNRLLGAAVYILLILIIESSILWLANGIGLISEETKANSIIISNILNLAPLFWSQLSEIFPFLNKMISELNLIFDQFNHKIS